MAEDTTFVEASVVTVSTSFKKDGVDSDTKDENETIEVRKFVTEPAKVTVNYGITMNMGNYESARIDVGVTIPCYKEELDDAHAFAIDWAESRLNKEIEALRSTKLPV